MNPYIKCIRGDSSYKVPTWADGTDEEIAEALIKHYNDEIDLNDYWTVGDERVVHLSAIAATEGYEAQPEQDVTLVLVNSGGRILTTPINNHTECAFVVGQKDCLAVIWPFISNNNQMYGWFSSNIRNKLNELAANAGYLSAIPATLRGIFKSHEIPCCDIHSSVIVSTDKSIVGLPARKEIIGTDDSNDKASSSYNQLAYYQDSSNRIKKVNGAVYTYFTNSKFYYKGSNDSTKKRIFTVSSEGTQSWVTSTNSIGVAPQMVI